MNQDNATAQTIDIAQDILHITSSSKISTLLLRY